MIAEAEIRRCAARWRVDPMVADFDYGLGWFLAAITLAGHSAGQMLFKGVLACESATSRTIVFLKTWTSRPRSI